MLLFTLAIGLMAFAALQRGEALSKELKLLRARLDALEATRAPFAEPPAANLAASQQAVPEPIAPESAPEAGTAPPPPPQPPWSLTEWLAGRGLVWVGALALGFAGLFLVRYSMENGLFGPLARVLSGLGLGLGLIAGGEWIARRDAGIAVSAKLTPRTALIGSGVCVLFTAGYGAYGVYGLIGALPAFVLLAGIAFAALALALRHGPLIALLGITGAFVIPAMVLGNDPSALALFLYLAAVVISSLTVVRIRNWWWLGRLATGGSLIWSILWLIDHQTATDTLVTAGFVSLALVMVPVWLYRLELPDSRGDVKMLIGTTLGALAILLIIIEVEDHGAVGLLWLGLVGAFTQWAALRQQQLIVLPRLSALTAVITYYVWTLPLPRDTGWLAPIEGRPSGHIAGALIEPAFMPYTLSGLAFAALFGFGGWYGTIKSARKGSWALLSVAVPLLILVIAYDQTAASALSPPWAFAALGLGALLVAATTELHRRLESEPELAIGVAFYAAGVTAATSLAMVMVLQDFWLTVAIAVQLPALAWIEARTRVPEMRKIALVLVSIVMARLLLNPYIADYDIGTTPIINGLFYGYGLPLAAFRLAQSMFRANRYTQGEAPPADDLLANVLAAGSIGLLALFVSLQLRHLIGHGVITDTKYSALEQGLQVVWWGCLALGLMRADRGHSTPVLAVAWRLLAALALGQVLLYGLFKGNPLWNDYSNGSWPLFNLVTLNYGVPALLAVIGTLEARRRKLLYSTQGGAAAAFILSWVFLTLTVRHAFQGPVLHGPDPENAEWYAYSAVWLAYGGGLLALGVRFAIPALCSAAMGVIIVTTLKVFIFDMNALVGLLRVASFLGLGLVLMLIGRLYQRTTLKPRSVARSVPPTEVPPP
ncbi:MAG: DUF2339 domain-containing protein [Rhodospirillaceae bacterium]